MALPLGKFTILVGAGLLGSVLAKEGRISTVSDFFSGAFKIVFGHVQQDDAPLTSKPQNDTLLAQVNSLRQELQLLASNRSVTIVTGSSSGAGSYGVPIVVVVGVVGYGYIWWKGWKLPDMMFATRRSLSDACTTVAKQLEQLHSSIAATKRNLSKRIDHVDSNLEECAQLNTATRDEVGQLRGDLRVFGVDVEEVHRQVQDLENKIGRIEGKQDLTNLGVHQLVEFVYNLEQSDNAGSFQASLPSSSRQALEPSQTTPASRTLSMPPALPLEAPSPSASGGTPRASRPLHTTTSASGLKDLQGVSPTVRVADPDLNRSCAATEAVTSVSSNSGSSSSNRFGWTSFLTRTHSATSSFK